MGCFLCTGESSSSSSTNNKKKPQIKRNDGDRAQAFTDKQKVSPHKQPKVINQSDQQRTVEEQCNSNMPSDGKFNARSFRYDEIVTATEDFKEDYFLGEGGFGKVYKGRLPDNGEIVAIKQLDRNGRQGIREFVVEAMMLCDGQHENLVKLIGYCADGEHRALVYEYMPLGSLEDNLYDTQPRALKVLDWNTRMKIAAGSAKGLEYLHNTMKIIYRDLKCSNILLGEGYHAKLSDFGLAKVGPTGDETHVSTRIMGTYGYCAPDYAMTGQLTFKSDIYSFGVVLLELITGRRAIDYRRTGPEHNLVAWARPLFKDRKNFHKMADSLLEGQYPVRGLYQSLAIAAMCLQEQPSLRPIIGDVVTALNYLASQTYDPSIHRVQNSIKSPSSLRFKRDVVEHHVETKDNGDERTKSED